LIVVAKDDYFPSEKSHELTSGGVVRPLKGRSVRLIDCGFPNTSNVAVDQPDYMSAGGGAGGPILLSIAGSLRRYG
jgi:hypothetical protein